MAADVHLQPRSISRTETHLGPRPAPPRELQQRPARARRGARGSVRSARSSAVRRASGRSALVDVTRVAGVGQPGVLAVRRRARRPGSGRARRPGRHPRARVARGASGTVPRPAAPRPARRMPAATASGRRGEPDVVGGRTALEEREEPRLALSWLPGTTKTGTEPARAGRGRRRCSAVAGMRQVARDHDDVHVLVVEEREPGARRRCAPARSSSPCQRSVSPRRA